MTTLFISDLHLDPSRPAVTRAFLHFLEDKAASADALYILGDLFEAWVGDDDDAPLATEAQAALRALTAQGVPVYVLHGNRDFLLGRQFAETTGCQLLPDPATVSLYGKPVLLMHGDLLCTDDREYMAFRAQCRSEAWQQQVLAQPLAQRRALAGKLREDSREANSNKPEDIMDVNPDAVLGILDQFDMELLIHGHTHRPDVHRLECDGKRLTRAVLGDWDRQLWYIEYSPDHQLSLLRADIDAQA